MTPFIRIEQHSRDMTKTELMITDYIRQNPIHVVRHTLTELASMIGGSNAAIIRFCQKLGYDGFADFKYDMSRYLLTNVDEEKTNSQDPFTSIVSTYTRYMAQIPQVVSSGLLETIAGYIVQANFIATWGINRTNLPATQLCNRLLRIGIQCCSTGDHVQMSDYSNIMKMGDLCLLFTVSGKGSKSYTDYFIRLKERGCTTVLITMDSRLKTLSKYSDQTVILPWIGNDQSRNFYDDQIIFLMFIELLLYQVASLGSDLNQNQSQQPE